MLRAFLFIDLFLILSEYLDKVSVIGLTGERGVPLVVTLSYIPVFYEVATNVFFYRRARKMRFSIEEISRPILVEMVKIADDLYKSYTLKLYGNFTRKTEFRPSKQDIVPMILGVSALCLSLLIPISLVK
ncbi:hypothetical protein [Metallosphaera hakonensis]|uniref:hypothetical protein n=1 Tax=Metallosphaera hakonensis TaxID=79601 RepID=UPI0006D07B24|nr:hypothetical protein [Metallosphaera hakonensis]